MTSNGGVEPVILANGGRVYPPFAVVELVRGKKGSIRGALRGVLGGRVPNPSA
jgi:hypothetical protein